MIPKNIFYIWIYDKINNIPDYLQISKKSFERMNSGYNIQILNYSIDYLKTSKEFYEFRTIVNDKESILHKLIFKICNYIYEHQYKYNNMQIQKLLNIPDYMQLNISQIVDALKYYIINKYGGIYFDCDTQFFKKIDEHILMNTGIRVKYDYYFLAGEKNSISIDNFKTYSNAYKNFKIIQQKCIWEDSNTKEKFVRGLIPYNFKYYSDDNDDYYFFDHYVIRSWINNDR